MTNVLVRHWVDYFSYSYWTTLYSIHNMLRENGMYCSARCNNRNQWHAASSCSLPEPGGWYAENYLQLHNPRLSEILTWSELGGPCVGIISISGSDRGIRTIVWTNGLIESNLSGSRNQLQIVLNAAPLTCPQFQLWAIFSNVPTFFCNPSNFRGLIYKLDASSNPLKALIKG